LEITAYQELMTNIEELNVLGIYSDLAAEVLAKIWNEPDDLDQFRETRVLFLCSDH